MRSFVGMGGSRFDEGGSLSQLFLAFVLIGLLVEGDYKVVLKLLKELFSFE